MFFHSGINTGGWARAYIDGGNSYPLVDEGR
jgi:hypothetical protein